MATVFRILLWGLVLIAPGGILLAPLLAAHELRRRSANRAKSPELLATERAPFRRSCIRSLTLALR